MRNRFVFWLMGSILTVLATDVMATENAAKADLILHSGNIITVDKKNPRAEAIAIQGDRILAIGRNRVILEKAGPRSQVIDLKGKTVIPGLIDSHAHFQNLGEQKRQVNLRYAADWEDAVRLVAADAKKWKPGVWILGRGWHQEKWNPAPSPQINGFPVHDLLSKSTPDHPVLLVHGSGHAVCANAMAMKLAGIDEKTPNPPGGEILRDSTGKAIGIFTENASDLIYAAFGKYQDSLTPEQKESESILEIQAADRECLENGITTIHDAGVSFRTIDLYRSLVDQDRIGVRLWAMVSEQNQALDQRLKSYRYIGYRNHHLTVRAIKRLLDGALGSRSAWMSQPYEDRPGNYGLNTIELADLKETARLAKAHGFQMAVHAIGDRANHELLDLYESFAAPDSTLSDLRWRVEHAQHLDPVDIPRFGKLGVLSAMQGVHATSDAPFIVKRLGKKRAEEGAYVWRSLLQAGARISNGTDAPVEEVNPLACFYSSVTRRTHTGQTFFPEQRMTRQEALESYTIHGAYAGFEEEIKGSLEAGKLADLVVLSDDIMSIPEEKIRETKVVMTLIGGKIVYSLPQK